MVLFSFSFLFFFFCSTGSLNSGPSPWATLPDPFFCDAIFWDRVSWTICLGWLWTEILRISASWVARITGLSHWHPTIFPSLDLNSCHFFSIFPKYPYILILYFCVLSLQLYQELLMKVLNVFIRKRILRLNDVG
jgi:hypothetical protein